LLQSVGGELVEFCGCFSADGDNGGAFDLFCISPCLFGGDFGFDGFKINKPAFKNGLSDVFKGLVGFAV
jgi:hypothetical protein